MFGHRSCGSSVGIVSDYRLDERGSIAVRGKGFFPLTFVSRPTLRPNRPPTQWVQWALSPGV
jgi:hypothetical protein